MCWPALSALPCARAPQLYPHKEYVITGEPGLTDDRVWSHNAGRRESFCPGAIIRLTTASSSVFGHCQNFLQVSSSLCHRLPFCFFMFWPSSLPDVPGYMPLLSVVQGTKTITRKGEEGGKRRRWKCKFTASRTLYKHWVVLWHSRWFGMSCFPATNVWKCLWNNNDRILCGFSRRRVLLRCSVGFRCYVQTQSSQALDSFLWLSTQPIRPNYPWAVNTQTVTLCFFQTSFTGLPVEIYRVSPLAEFHLTW